MSVGSQKAEVVLVTGSSSGIGEACCERLSHNRHVYGASRTDTDRKRWSYVKMDVTDEESVKTAVGSIMLREGRIDAVVHCAGLSLAGPVEETTCDEALRQFETNYFGTIRVLCAVLPVMRRQASGKIIIIGSIAGLIGLPYLGHYSATKFALDGLVEALRQEVLRFGIYVSLVHPGDFNTQIGEHRIYRKNANSSSEYISAFEKAAMFYTAAEKRGRSPDVIAHKIEAILARKQPRMRYVIGTPLEVLGVWAKSVLPSDIFAYLFRKLYLP
jgi:NAD(P)-dependent dehydrogenase (short-subunit alcohol dehydrogenase family)